MCHYGHNIIIIYLIVIFYWLEVRLEVWIRKWGDKKLLGGELLEVFYQIFER